MDISPKYKKIIDKWFEKGCKDGTNVDIWIEYSKTDNRETAHVGWHRMIRNDKVREYIHKKHQENQERLLIEHHVGMGDITKKLKQIGIEGVLLGPPNEDDETNEFVRAPEVLRALDMLTKIIGGYAAEKKDFTSDGDKMEIKVNIIKPKDFEA